jgi:hypothetical protein
VRESEEESVAAEENKMPGRNEPCHCGSGRKYKQCCLGKDEAAQREARAGASAEAAAAGGDSAKPPKVAQTPRHKTQQPWKGAANTPGFSRVNVPRRSGGS